MLGIISYLPDDPAKRAMRREMIKRALDWNADIFKYEDYKVVVLQNYTKEEAEVFEGFKKVYRKPLGAAGARNVLLDILENSDEKWLWVADDDIMFYKYYGIAKTVREFKENPALDGIDVVTFLDPRFQGFRSLLDNQPNIASHLFFTPQQTMNTGTGSYLIRNARQASKPPIRFHEDYREKKFREDIAFLLDCLDAGKILQTCPQIVFKWDTGDGGVIAKNKSSQTWIFELPPHELEKGLAEKYKLTYDPVSGNIKFGRYSKMVSRTSKFRAVKRLYPLEESEYTEFAKKRTYSKKTKRIMKRSEGEEGLFYVKRDT